MYGPNDPSGAHHGVPTMTNADVKLVECAALWIKTARESSPNHKNWYPTHVDILKSRLFWRIRSGKPPLPYAPPTAFSCPWYELIDEPDRAHWAYDGHEINYGEGPVRMSIAQDVYNIVVKKSDRDYILKQEHYYFHAFKGVQKCSAVKTVADGSDIVEVEGEEKEWHYKYVTGWFIQHLPDYKPEEV